jgi:hypothetical protein
MVDRVSALETALIEIRPAYVPPTIMDLGERVTLDREGADDGIEMTQAFAEIRLIGADLANAKLGADLLAHERFQLADSIPKSDCAADLVFHVVQDRLSRKRLEQETKPVSEVRQLLGPEGHAVPGLKAACGCGAQFCFG